MIYSGRAKKKIDLIFRVPANIECVKENGCEAFAKRKLCPTFGRKNGLLVSFYPPKLESQ